MIFYQGKKKIKLRSNFMKMLLPYAQEDRGRRESSLPPSTSRADVLTDGDMSGLTTMIPAETQHSYALLFCFSSDVVSLRGHAEQNLPT
ncbi:mCG140854, isoform CRA_a [Mus musculus]|nr:mCG140854, isoform CRA_a [Mus musculus]EDL32730.1 mCG140854, isoform CRA_a [Mus musculus]